MPCSPAPDPSPSALSLLHAAARAVTGAIASSDPALMLESYAAYEGAFWNYLEQVPDAAGVQHAWAALCQFEPDVQSLRNNVTNQTKLLTLVNYSLQLIGEGTVIL